MTAKIVGLLAFILLTSSCSMHYGYLPRAKRTSTKPHHQVLPFNVEDIAVLEQNDFEFEMSGMKDLTPLQLNEGKYYERVLSDSSFIQIGERNKISAVDSVYEIEKPIDESSQTPMMVGVAALSVLMIFSPIGANIAVAIFLFLGLLAVAYLVILLAKEFKRVKLKDKFEGVGKRFSFERIRKVQNIGITFLGLSLIMLLLLFVTIDFIVAIVFGILAGLLFYIGLILILISLVMRLI